MRAEYNAFKTQLAVPTQLAGKVSTSLRTNTAGEPVRANYVVAKPALPDRLEDERYTAQQSNDSNRFFSYEVVFVAVDADGALILAEAALTHLIRLVLEVPGRKCEAIALADDSRGAQVEYDVKSNLYYLSAFFEFWSRRP